MEQRVGVTGTPWHEEGAGGTPGPCSPESQRRKASVLSRVRLPSEREMMGSLPWKLFMVPA